MTPRCLALLALLALPSLGQAADIGIELSGVLTADGKTRVAITDKASKSTTWLESGGILNGYTVDRYDPKEDTVFLKKNGEEVRLRLIASKTPEPSRPVLSATPPRPPTAAPPNPANSSAPSTPAPSSPANIANSTANAAPANPASAATASSAVPTPLPAAAATSAAATTATPPPTTQETPPATDPAANLVPATDSPASTTAAGSPVESSPAPTGRLLSGPNYRVQTGDTVESIALTHGVSTQQIRQLNPSLNSTSLRTGETIRIRPE